MDRFFAVGHCSSMSDTALSVLMQFASKKPAKSRARSFFDNISRLLSRRRCGGGGAAQIHSLIHSLLLLPEILALKHESRILGHSSNPVLYVFLHDDQGWKRRR